MSLELLYEIGCEELPASFIQPALAALKGRFTEALAKWGLPTEGVGAATVETAGTPRRLVLLVGGLPAETPRRTVTVTGPPAASAWKDGAPTKAAEGFARSRGVDPSALRVVETAKGPYVGVDIEEGGLALRPLLTSLLPDLTLGLPFRKSMRWGSRPEKWGRPLRWIVAVFGGEVLDFAVAGVPSGRVTHGLRFHGPRTADVGGIADWRAAMAQMGIVPDAEARKDTIRGLLRARAAEVGGVPEIDEDLLDEVANLVECPRVIRGAFDEVHLALPAVVPVTVMKHHQRYFPVFREDGALVNAFLQVTNNPDADEAVVRQGNQRVLTARLSDGTFFWQEDLKAPLESRLYRLDGIIYHALLGTTGEKVERMRRLGWWLAAELGLGKADVDRIDRASQLAKADLVTWMVGEFPELQGRMGMEYALRFGEDPLTARALFEHYQPIEAGGALPGTDVGAVVALADKVDAIVAFHAIGKGPTGATDPYALRRASLGVLRILADRGWDISLTALVDHAFSLVAHKVKRGAPEVREEVLTFLRTRLKGLLAGEDIPTDFVEAVLAAGADRVGDATLRARALRDVAASPDFRSLMTAFKRAVNISRDQPDGGEAAAARLTGEGARLRDAVAAVRVRVDAATARRDYAAALTTLLDLKGPVDAFFDTVLVMDPDPAVRESRLAVLHQVAALFAGIADFGRLTG